MLYLPCADQRQGSSVFLLGATNAGTQSAVWINRASFSASISGLHPYISDRVLRIRFRRAIIRVVMNLRTCASAASSGDSIALLMTAWCNWSRFLPRNKVIPPMISGIRNNKLCICEAKIPRQSGNRINISRYYILNNIDAALTNIGP